MIKINNKVEILRALERTEEQFDDLIEKNCKGELQDPITVVTPNSSGGVDRSTQPTVQGHTFSKADKEFLEAFKKIYQLGLFQLCPDILGIISTVNRSNSSTPVFTGLAVNASIGIFDKCPVFMQRELNDIVRTTTRVFNYNFQSSIIDDNTLPYIDKLPDERVRREEVSGYTYGAVGNYMLKDVKFFNVIKNITQSIIDIVRVFLGSDAFRLLQFKKNINYFNAEQNVSNTSNNSISRLLVFMDQVTSETGNTELKEKCIELQTGLAGNVVVDDTSLILDGADLHTVQGSVGSGGSVPFGGDPWRIPTTPTTPTPTLTGDDVTTTPSVSAEEDLCPVECDDTTLNY